MISGPIRCHILCLRVLYLFLFSSHLCLPVAVFKRQVSHSVCKNTKWAENNTKCSALYRGCFGGVIILEKYELGKRLPPGKFKLLKWRRKVEVRYQVTKTQLLMLHSSIWASFIPYFLPCYCTHVLPFALPSFLLHFCIKYFVILVLSLTSRVWVQKGQSSSPNKNYCMSLSQFLRLVLTIFFDFTSSH